jgi:hypothetical protein
MSWCIWCQKVGYASSDHAAEVVRKMWQRGVLGSAGLHVYSCPEPEGLIKPWWHVGHQSLRRQSGRDSWKARQRGKDPVQ